VVGYNPERLRKFKVGKVGGEGEEEITEEYKERKDHPM